MRSDTGIASPSSIADRGTDFFVIYLAFFTHHSWWVVVRNFAFVSFPPHPAGFAFATAGSERFWIRIEVPCKLSPLQFSCWWLVASKPYKPTIVVLLSLFDML